MNAFDLTLVKNLKKELAESNKDMEELTAKILDIFGPQNIPHFKIGINTYQLIETKSSDGGQGIWKLELIDDGF